MNLAAHILVLAVLKVAAREAASRGTATPTPAPTPTIPTSSAFSRCSPAAVLAPESQQQPGLGRGYATPKWLPFISSDLIEILG